MVKVENVSVNGNDKGEGSPVGRGHPPRSGQYQKGQTGNPRGRPRGALGVAKRLRAALSVTADDGTNPLDRMIAKLVAEAESDSKKAMVVIAMAFKHDEKVGDDSEDSENDA